MGAPSGPPRSGGLPGINGERLCEYLRVCVCYVIYSSSTTHCAQLAKTLNLPQSPRGRTLCMIEGEFVTVSRPS